MTSPAGVFASFAAVWLAVRLLSPAKERKRPAPDAGALFFNAFNALVAASFYGALPLLALLTPALSRFDYPAPAALHWLSIPVFADSVWTFWLARTGMGRDRSKFDALWIWTVGQSLCIPNVWGGVGSLAGFGLLCLARIVRRERKRMTILPEEQPYPVRRDRRAVPAG